MLLQFITAATLLAPISISPLDSAPPGDPTTMLKIAADACKALSSARYKAVWEVRDELTPRKLEGDVAFVRWPVEAEAPPPPPAKPNPDGSIPAIAMTPMKLKTMYNADLRIELAEAELRTFNHDRAAVWNPAANTFKIMPAAEGGEQLLLGDSAVMLLATPLLQPESLARMAGPNNQLKLGPRENVHGVECEVITARLPKPDIASDITMTVALGVEDHLPRRTVFEHFTDGQSVVRHEVLIKDIAINPELDAAIFTLLPPEGMQVEVVKAEPQQEMLSVGSPAPEFTLKDAAGKDVSLADLKGRIVLLDFWGTWCGPCKMAMPSIQKLHAKYKNRGVAVIGISCREKPGADPAKTMTELGCDYGLLLNGETIAKQWQVPGYPTLYLIDREGRIAHAELGFDEDLEAKLREAIEGLMKK